jgi:hypothetical protein
MLYFLMSKGMRLRLPQTTWLGVILIDIIIFIFLFTGIAYCADDKPIFKVEGVVEVIDGERCFIPTKLMIQTETGMVITIIDPKLEVKYVRN